MAGKRSRVPAATRSREPQFWHDAALPFVEARAIEDGRELAYGRHFHETFSIGIVAGGRSSYVNGHARESVAAGTVVLMNPGDAHACNPLGDEPWSYRMLYFDAAWLGGIQQQIGAGTHPDFHAYTAISSRRPDLYRAVNDLHAVLTSPEPAPEKESAAIDFATEVHRALARVNMREKEQPRRLARAHEFIRDNYTRPLKVDEICAASQLSPSYLIRAFKRKYGMTPHAYITNCRVEYCRTQLRRGRPVAEIAAEAGFADQAHLQRTFKKLVAATPGQFRNRFDSNAGTRG